MQVKIKKLLPEAVIPKYAMQGDAGMDLVATSVSKEKGLTVYGTGLAFEIPEGYVGLLLPRSSNANTTNYLTNSCGVLDSGYRGEVMFKYRSVLTWINPIKYWLRKVGLKVGINVAFIGNADTDYKVGDRIGQIIIMPYPHIEFEEAEELSETERGSGGYGSTGK